MFLASALKDAARTKASEENKSYHLQDDPDYGTDVYRVQDVTCLDCWYGFIVTQNNSKYNLREIVAPTLEGLEVVWPPTMDEDGQFNIELPPKTDHIIVLRRTESQCTFGLRYMTHPRPMTDAEIIEQTKQLDELNYFGEYNVFYRLFNREDGACFFFENYEEDKHFVTTFDLQLENLKIVGMKNEDSSSFTVELAPGQSQHVILRPMVEGGCTSIQMRYNYELKETK